MYSVKKVQICQDAIFVVPYKKGTKKGIPMTNKRLLNQTTTTHTDFKTGEIRSESKTNVVRLPQEPPYVKMYIDDLCDLMHIPAAQKQTLELLIRKLDYEGFITLSPRYRKQLCERLKIKDQTFRNRLAALCKTGVMRRHSTNEYEVNPRYFARGEWRHICERREAFKMTVKYSENGREIITEAEEQPELQLI